jgi:ATP-dependent DNA helicase RecG
MIIFKETEERELKKSTSELKEAVISIASILNKHQKGELYFGIKNDGTVVGQTVTENTIREISRTIADNLKPELYPTIKQLKIENKDCVIVEFRGSEIPYFAYGRAYIRVGDEDRQLSAKEVEKYIINKNKDKLRWDNEICDRATVKDIDEEAIKKFIDLVKESKRLRIEKENTSTILTKLDLMRDGKLTNAAVLLFGKNPSGLFDNAIVKCGRFKDVTKSEFIDMKDYEGNLFTCLEKSIEFIKNHLRITAKIEGLLRKERWEIPIEAIREALINALIHRDYFSSGFIYIKMYDNEIVIANPGKLPDSLKIDDLYKEHESKPNNPLLAKTFYYTGYIDTWGRGILNIIKFLKEEGQVAPSFEESGGYFRICFTRPESSDGLKKTIVGGSEKNSEKIFVIIRQIPDVTREELHKMTGLSIRGIEWNLAKLKEEGKIRRVGGDKSGHWEIPDENRK